MSVKFVNKMNKQNSIKVAAIQYRCDLIANENNLNNLIDKIQIAAKNKAKLIVLPELHNYPYFCQQQRIANFKLAETIPGKTSKRLCILAKKLNIVIIASIFEKDLNAENYYNTACVCDSNGQIAGIYRKMHIPDDPGYNEKYYFTPGNLGFNSIQTSIGKLGILVCWDQWFPEAARLMRLSGAEILIYPTAIGWEQNDNEKTKQQQLNAWKIMQQSHAIANHIPVISCNRVGFEPLNNDKSASNQGNNFWGNSFICDSGGTLLAQASHDNEEIIYANIDRQYSENISLEWPFFRDRRIEFYKNLSE